jgi:2-keto-4-pentenoate hydratase
MLDKDQIAAASQVLVQHWRDGSKLDALETRLRPQSRSEGYAVQAALGDQMFGWKIAAIQTIAAERFWIASLRSQ